MQPKLQRRIQRYGWDLAAGSYESLWQAQLWPAQAALLECAALAAGECVLDVACGTGLVSFAAADAVGAGGRIVGTDISGGMVDAARERASQRGTGNAEFFRMDAEELALPDESFDAALCALGFMYLPRPEVAAREMRRVLRPGGRVVAAVWGKRSACGWSPVFPITDAEVRSDVCPMFFSLGEEDALARVFADVGLEITEQRIISTLLRYSNADQACDAAFVGGPVALAYTRFDAPTRVRVRAKYTEAIEPWRCGQGYEIPGQFVVVAARSPSDGAERKR
jgi:ubiquinone/menaquinone biosynthesis C-methylase UbiE